MMIVAVQQGQLIVGLLAEMPPYRPFLDPLPDFGPWWWLLLIPLALGISIAYKAVRVRSMDRYWPNVLTMTVQIVLAMVLLAVGAHVFVEWIVPALGG